MSLTGYDQLRDNYTTGEPLEAVLYNSHVQILDSQLHGALEGVGAGVIEGGEVSAGVGLGVDVAALKAIADTSKGKTYLATGLLDTVTGLTPNTTVYIHAGAEFATDPEDNDSRESGEPLLFMSLLDTEVDAVLLAEVETGGSSVSSVTDRRTFAGIAGLQLLIDALEARADTLEADTGQLKLDLGDGYYDEEGVHVDGEASVHDRLAALESGGGGGGSLVYWKPLAASSGDATTIDEAIAAAVGAGGGGGGGGSTGGDVQVVQVPSDTEIENHLLLVLRLEHALPEVEETQQHSYFFLPGINDVTLYDPTLTTATVDFVNHTLA